MATTVGLYSIWDRKAGYYLPAFQDQTDANAIRQFTEIVTMSETPIAKYPADFDLVRIGSFEIETGYIEPINPVHLIINGLVCLENAHRERSRYQAILGSTEAQETATDAS